MKALLVTRTFLWAISGDKKLSWLDHVLRVESLPMHHRDPFDRMLIAQSQEQKLPLVTSDVLFQRYDIDVIW